MFLSSNNWDIIQRRIRIDFEAVIDWMFRNSLRLNRAKTKAIIFSTRCRLSILESPTHFSYMGNTIGFV